MSKFKCGAEIFEVDSIDAGERNARRLTIAGLAGVALGVANVALNSKGNSDAIIGSVGYGAAVVGIQYLAFSTNNPGVVNPLDMCVVGGINFAATTFVGHMIINNSEEE